MKNTATCLGLVLLGLLCPRANAAPEGAPQLVEALMERHGYLFKGADRAALDKAHRLFRQADAIDHPQWRQPAPPLPDGKTTDDLRQEAWAMAGDVLARADSAIEVDLRGDVPKVTPGGPVSLPGSEGALLYRVVRGDAGVRCVHVELSMIMREMAQPISIATLPGGITYALVSLRDLPMGRTHHRVTFGGEGSTPVTLPVAWQTPRPGRLALTVLSDDTGEPAPAMVQLRWETDGRVYPPSNAVDLATRFEGQGNASSRRSALLPGELRGDYYCVPGPFDMMLQPGEWRITVRRGLEHVPVVETVMVPEGGLVTRTCRPRRWVNMVARGWYSGDDHVHFRMMNDLDAEILMAWVRAEDIHVANVVRMGDISRTYFEQRGWGPAYRVLRGAYALSPGQECPRTHNELGHTLAMNTTGMVRDTERYYLYDEHFDQVHAQGGLAGYAHVNANLFHVERDMTMNIPRGKVDFVEIFQFGSLGLQWYYDFLNMGFKVTACCGSDVPWAGTVGEERVYAYVGTGPFKVDDWFAALRRGNTFVTNGPMIEFTVDGALPGEEILVDGPRTLHVKARAFGNVNRARPVRLDIIVHGEVVHSVTPGDDTEESLEAILELDPGQGYWIAARAEGGDGSRAHTTPVYVIRKGLRFWKYDALEPLFEKRRASLAEIRRIVADAQGADSRGELEANRALKQLSRQGKDLLKRVTQAEAYYVRLEETARQERAIRGEAVGRPG